jgi:hypothetical protein
MFTRGHKFCNKKNYGCLFYLYKIHIKNFIKVPLFTQTNSEEKIKKKLGFKKDDVLKYTDQYGYKVDYNVIYKNKEIKYVDVERSKKKRKRNDERNPNDVKKDINETQKKRQKTEEEKKVKIKVKKEEK